MRGSRSRGEYTGTQSRQIETAYIRDAQPLSCGPNLAHGVTTSRPQGSPQVEKLARWERWKLPMARSSLILAIADTAGAELDSLWAGLLSTSYPYIQTGASTPLDQDQNWAAFHVSMKLDQGCSSPRHLGGQIRVGVDNSLKLYLAHREQLNIIRMCVIATVGNPN